MSNLDLTRDGWHTEHSNIVTLVYLAEREGYTASEIVRIVEKPWKWRAEFCIAYCKSADRQRATPSPSPLSP